LANRSSIDQHTWWNKIKNHRYIRFILFCLLGFVTFGLLFSNVIPQTVDIESGNIATDSIRSPVTVENKAETERLQQEAVDSVEPAYSLNPRYADNQIERLNDVFASVRLVQLEIRDQRGELTSIGDGGSEAEDQPVWSEEEQIQELRGRISPEIAEQLSDDVLLTFLESSSEELQTAQETAASAVHDVMSEEVSLAQVEAARDIAEEKVRLVSVRSTLEEAMAELTRHTVTANYMIDEDATLEAREEAAESVEPVLIREGELLVEEGQVITSDVYDQLTLAGLTDDTSVYTPYFGLALLIFLMMFLLSYYLNDANTTLKSNNTHLLLFMLIYTVTLSIMKLTSFLQPLEPDGIAFVVPAAAGTMLVSMLLQSRVALFMSFLLGIASGIMFNYHTTATMDYSFALYVFFSGVAGVFFLSKSNHISRMLKTGTFIAAVNVTIASALLLLKGVPMTLVETGIYAGSAVAGGYIAIILAVGLLPFFEAGFGILSTSKLIELSNPNHPLLRKILLEAPGTYHHSVVVANLAEGACEAIGANGLLARVGAYYHDIGKTKRPQFFIENQMRISNPHDKIAPKVSASIIIAHPYDGAEMLKKYRLPKEIIDIAEQHHGTTQLKYFYFKAREKSTDVKESDYRYPGPKAQTKESAVLGVADSVEAAVRSMQAPTQEKIEELVRKIINDRLEDGQFDECDLTLKELHTVYVSICESLKGTFHSRIDYPDEKDLPKVEGENR
jgi:cyclic-di-AMP phosphodiesterase PgpH